MYELFEHTADLGLRVEAQDLDALFRDAAEGLFSIIVEPLAFRRVVGLGVLAEQRGVDAPDALEVGLSHGGGPQREAEHAREGPEDSCFHC